jgi:hypothetical protein
MGWECSCCGIYKVSQRLEIGTHLGSSPSKHDFFIWVIFNFFNEMEPKLIFKF